MHRAFEILDDLIRTDLAEDKMAERMEAMSALADRFPFCVVADGPWGFEALVGASTLQGANVAAQAFVKRYQVTERYAIWSQIEGLPSRRVIDCDVIAPSDDDRTLQALGWPTASEREPEDGVEPWWSRM